MAGAGSKPGAGETAPMPPVLGPVSPSPTRLWSRAVPRNTASVPSHSANRLTSSPSRHSSITTGPAAIRRSIAASASASVCATTTPLPAARPSALTTIGGAAAAGELARLGGVGEALPARGGDAGGLGHLLGEGLAAFQPGRGGGRAAAGDARRRHRVRQAGDQRRLRARHHQVDLRCGWRTAPARRGPVAPIGTSSASGAMPGLPGATHSLVSSGEAASAQASACSRPPDPISSTRIPHPQPCDSRPAALA